MEKTIKMWTHPEILWGDEPKRHHPLTRPEIAYGRREHYCWGPKWRIEQMPFTVKSPKVNCWEPFTEVCVILDPEGNEEYWERRPLRKIKRWRMDK